MFDFKLPDLGEGVHEGQIVNVLVKEGEPINEFQPMLEVETDKAAVEIPSPKGGKVAKVHVQAGQMVKVGQIMITIDDAGGGSAAPAAPTAKPAAASAPAKPAAPPPAPARPAAPSPAPARPAPAPVAASRTPVVAPTPAPAPAVTAIAARGSNGPVAAAPAVRKLARELNVDINLVAGSGPGGRIVKEDVERFASGGAPLVSTSEAAGAAFAPVPMMGAELPDFSTQGPIRRETPPQIRKTIARAMTRAWQNVPRVTHADKADITELERNRKAYNATLKEGQAKLTVTAILIKAVAAGLREYPMLNCSWDAAAEEVIYKDYYNIGIAVDTPRGLVVPVLRDADRKSLPQIAAELNDISSKARAAAFAVNDLRGGTFSITNVGAIGGLFFTPMVNFPEVGILGVGKAALEPAVRDGQIVPRLMMSLSLSFDHRICDGADAARFVTEVISSLENPLRLLSLG